MIYSPLKYFALAGITIFMISCSSDKKEELPPVSPVERSKPAPPQKTEPEPLRISYQLDSLESAAAVDSFAQRYSEAEKEIIFGINRMDPNRLSAGDRIVIPDTLTSDFLDYAPFPRKYRILDTCSDFPKNPGFCAVPERRVSQVGSGEFRKGIHPYASGSLLW